MTPITLQDVNKYIATIRINFENAYKTQTDDERKILLQSWHAILKDYPKEICDNAVIKAIKHAKFAPRIGDIVEQIEKMQVAFEKTDNELWSELTGCLGKVRYNSYRFRFNAIEENGLTEGENCRQRVKAIFESLSPELKDYLRDSRGLIEVAEYTDEQLSFERGRFMRILPQLRERAKTRHSVGDQLAALIEGMSVYTSIGCNDMKLLKGSEKR